MPWELTGNSGTDAATDLLGTTDGQPLVIETNALERMRITVDGNVGIGTAGLGDKLDIQASGTYSNLEFNRHPFAISTGNSNSDFTLFMGADKNNRLSYIQSVHVWTGKTTLALNPQGGNVGIGTTGLGDKLDILASGTYSNLEFNGHPLAISTGNGSSDYTLFMGADKNNRLSYIQSINVWTRKATLALNPQGGNVGIGTSQPGATLTVAGMIQTTTGGIKFPDGSVQTTATLRGPQGPQGPQGPAGPPVRTSAVCVNGEPNANGSRTCNCAGGKLISQVISNCTVTSDTGTCSASTAYWQSQVMTGACCVCAPT
jgi:hypothetical protein